MANYCFCVVIAFLLRPTSIHHTPYHAQHHVGITLELRPLRLYRFDQSDRVACKRRFSWGAMVVLECI